MRIVVAGGTGLVGRHLVDTLTGEHQEVVLARSTGVDLTTGRGVEDALAGADAVVDVTHIRTQRRRASVDFFTMASTSGRAVASGALLPTAAGPRGVQKFDEWLEHSVAPASSGSR